VGEDLKQPLQLSFNASLKIDFQGSRVTSDGGLILVRELDERLRFGELVQQHLTDSRRGKNTQFPFADLLRQSVYSRLAGYEDLNDAERLSQDPTFRLIGSEKNLGSRGGSDLTIAELRDRDADPGGELCRTGATQPGADRESGSRGLGLPDDPGHGFHRGPGLLRAGTERLQRVHRVHLFSSSAAVQQRG